MSVTNFLTFVAHHPHFAYGTIFLIALSESLAFVGLLVPGTVLMFGVGAIIATGSLALKPTLVVATLGAIAGDGISYWLGRHYQHRLLDIWPFKRHPQMLSRGETFFHRHGGKSILFGRFVGPVRPVIPIVAGMLGMQPLKFTLVNILSAIGWAFAYVVPGVFFGASLTLAGAVSARLTVLILLVVTLVWFSIWLCRQLVRLTAHLGPRWLASLRAWLTKKEPVFVVLLPVKRALSFLLLRQKGEEFVVLFLLAVLLLATWGFLGVLQAVLARDPLVQVDQAVLHFFQSLRTPWADHFFVVVTELGDKLVTFSVAAVISLILLSWRCYRAAFYWILTAAGGFCIVRLLKWLLHLPRPVTLYHGTTAFGFPSGHTTMNIIIYGFFVLLIARDLQNFWRWFLVAAAGLLTLAIAFSRLYLGVHWLSDVLGGFLLASAWLALMGIFYIRGGHETVPRQILGLATLVVFVTVGSWHVADRHQKDLGLYSQRHPVQLMKLQTWWASGWQGLPPRRTDLQGKGEQPLTIQWAGSLKDLSQFLLAHGWQRPAPINLKVLLNMLSPHTTIQELPLLPNLQEGRLESTLLVQEHGNERWVLRMWPTDVQLQDAGESLWIGTVEVQVSRRLADFITMARDKGDYLRPLLQLSENLEGKFKLRRVFRHLEETSHKRSVSNQQWNGLTLLATSISAMDCLLENIHPFFHQFRLGLATHVAEAKYLPCQGTITSPHHQPSGAQSLIQIFPGPARRNLGSRYCG
ncbi:MAG: VTT domain-containing protein [Deltaproteobacteria bacterium]|nr:VTT domain-containing protein [Deltaproteobacteria bacterium]